MHLCFAAAHEFSPPRPPNRGSMNLASGGGGGGGGGRRDPDPFSTFDEDERITSTAASVEKLLDLVKVLTAKVDSMEARQREA